MTVIFQHFHIQQYQINTFLSIKIKYQYNNSLNLVTEIDIFFKVQLNINPIYQGIIYQGIIYFNINNIIESYCLHEQNQEKELQFFQNQGIGSLQCGLHCVNHLLGTRAYQPKDFKQICYRLSDQFVNPHKHVCGGDYSVDVIILALSQKGFDCQWQDRRKQFAINQSPQTLGYIVNQKTEKKFYHKMFGLSARHWIAIKRIGQTYFQFDSKKQNKLPIGNKKYAEDAIKAMMKKESQIIRVFKK